MSYPRQPGRPRSLPQKILCNILCHLPTASLFTASLVSREWQALIFESGPVSNFLLRPHLSVLRERFGFQQVPHRLPIPAVRGLLLRYAKQELSGTFCAKEIYNIRTFNSRLSTWSDRCSVPLRLRRFAVCGSLLAIATRSKHIYVFELTKRPIELLAKISVKNRPVALAISEAYLAVLGEDSVSMYSLLARNTPAFMVVHIYSVKVPQIRHPSAIAITPGLESTPLVAVLATSIYLIHPSYALTQKRGGFFRDHGEDEEEIVAEVSRKGKEKQPLSTPKGNPWVLVTAGSGVGASFPLAFSMYGRQVSLSAWGDNGADFQRSGYIGALWSNEDPMQLKQRHSLSLKDGENIHNASYSPDQLWRFYKTKLTYKKKNSDGSITPIATAKNRWQAHPIDTGGQMAIESAIHLYDSFYIVTEVTTRLVRIISMAPFSSKMILYRRLDPESGSESDSDVTAGMQAGHCGYVVVSEGGCSGYIAFNHRPGFVKILSIRQILMHGTVDSSEEQQMRIGQEITGYLREIAIGGGGEIVGMAGDAKRLVVITEDRVVVVRLWREDTPGRSVNKDAEPDWEVNRFGEVRRVGERISPLRRGMDCARCVVQ